MKKANLKKLTAKSLLAQVVVPMGCAALGSIAGAAAGKTYNLIVAAGLGAAGMVYGMPNLIYAGAGAVAVTPSKTMARNPITAAGLDGLDGMKEHFSAMKSRAFGQTRALLANTQVLQIVADKIPVSGLDGFDGTQGFELGYASGAQDTMLEIDGESSLEGYQFGAASTGVRQSYEAMMMR